jgi:hypothetical protein
LLNNIRVVETCGTPQWPKESFHVPKDRATKSVIEVIREIRAYARD